MADDYDVIIVGSGAGGGTLAHRLAPSGKRMLILERGDWLPREVENWDADGRLRRQPLRLGRHRGTTDRASRSSRRSTTSSAGPRSSTAPPSTGSASATSASCKHHGGISPAWPIGYDVMEPYYTQAEQLYQVHGARGEDPTEPPAIGAVPVPAGLPRAADPAAVRRPGRRRPAPVPLPLRHHARRGGPRRSAPCIRCATCDGFACLVHAKSDADVIAVRPAIEHENVTLRPQRRRTPAGDRRVGRTVTSVVADVDGDEQRFAGSIVVVSAGAANSAKLLLASASDRHPHGLANGSDQVGRNYVFHNSRAFLAVSTEKNDTRFQKTLGLNDYYFGDADFDYPMGNVQMVGKSSAPMYRGEKPIETKLAPTFALDEVAEHAVDFWLSAEDLPDPRQPGDARPRRQRRPQLHPEQPRADGAALPPGEEASQSPGDAPPSPDPA